MDKIILKLDMIQNQLKILEVAIDRVLDDIMAKPENTSDRQGLGSEILGWHRPLNSGE